MWTSLLLSCYRLTHVQLSSSRSAQRHRGGEGFSPLTCIQARRLSCAHRPGTALLDTSGGPAPHRPSSRRWSLSAGRGPGNPGPLRERGGGLGAPLFWSIKEQRQPGCISTSRSASIHPERGSGRQRAGRIKGPIRAASGRGFYWILFGLYFSAGYSLNLEIAGLEAG